MQKKHLGFRLFVLVVIFPYYLLTTTQGLAQEQPKDFKTRLAQTRLEECYKQLEGVGYEEAVIETATKIIEEIPDFFEAYYVLGGAFCKLTDRKYLLMGEDQKPYYFANLSKAEKNYEKALELNSEEDDYPGLGPIEWLRRVRWHIEFWNNHKLFNFSEYANIQERPVIDEFYKTKPNFSDFPW